MADKTLIICFKPSTVSDLLEIFDDGFTEVGYRCHENKEYIIASQLYMPQLIPVLERCKGQNAGDILKALPDIPFFFEYVDRDKEMDSKDFKQIKRLFCRNDITKIIWYVDLMFPELICGIEHLRRELWPITKAEYFLPCAYDEKGKILYPTERAEGIQVLSRHLSEIFAIDVSNKLIALYFTRAIHLLYESLYNEQLPCNMTFLEPIGVQGIRMVYENENKHFTTGTLIFLGLEKMFEKNSIPLEFKYFPDMTHGFVACIDKLEEYGLIKIKKNTLKIYHTEQRLRVLEIIKKYLPDYLDDKKYASWLKRGKRILNGRIQGGEFIQETIAFIKRSLEDAVKRSDGI